MTPPVYFGKKNKNFSEKKDSTSFYCLLNPNFMQSKKSEKKIISQSLEKGVTDGWTDRETDGQS